jgi:Haem-NO-binding
MSYFLYFNSNYLKLVSKAGTLCPFQEGGYMHGLIFVTWEKYLTERFGGPLLYAYRDAIGETPSNSPLASRLYDDGTLLAGVGAASRLTGVAADMLLREYGRYFIINGLTSHLCSYVLSQIHSGRALLLAMRDVHARLRQTREGLTPPLFNYETSSYANEVVLLYDSPRQLCSVLWGAIEGAAERFGEQVEIFEPSCMKKGAALCRLRAVFSVPLADPLRYAKTPEQLARQKQQKELADLVLDFLPDRGTTQGMSLQDLQRILQRHRYITTHQRRSAVLLEAVQHLQFAGLVASSADQPGDELTNRRYWRVRTFWDE